MEKYEGYDEEKMKSVWRRWCLIDKDYGNEAGTCWEEPRCDLDIIKEMSINDKYDLMLDIENLRKSAQELLAKVTNHGFDVRDELRTVSYTVVRLREIIRQMRYVEEEIDRVTVGE